MEKGEERREKVKEKRGSRMADARPAGRPERLRLQPMAALADLREGGWRCAAAENTIQT